jgi:hypothetical protein
MKYQDLLAIAGCIASASAVSVSGAAEGFAKGVTGGGSATAVYPSTTAELVSYLGDSEARVIVLTKTCVLGIYHHCTWMLTVDQIRLHRYRRHDDRDWLCALGNCLCVPGGNQPE